ncbi:MAG: hypothetical protein AB1753_01895 [Thermoproteota archaeon]
MVKVVHHASDRLFEKALDAALAKLARTAKIENISYSTSVVVGTDESEKHYFTAFIEYAACQEQETHGAQASQKEKDTLQTWGLLAAFHL